MLKALIKKQLLELSSFYFQDRKNGKLRSKSGMIGFGILYAVIFLGLAAVFGSLSVMIGSAMIPAGLGWLYYAFMGIMAIFLGVFGGVFNTYASLYLARDNEALMSMPIPSSYILLSRMLGVFAMSFFYGSLVFVPAVIYYLISAFSFPALVGSILLWISIGLFCMVLCCFLGWIIAVISVKIKNKSFITVILSLIFFAVYYWVCGNYYYVIEELLLHMDTISASIHGKAYPLYALGMAGTGDMLSLLIVLLFVTALCALTIFILSKTFLKISSIKGSNTKAVFKEDSIKASSIDKTLLSRELKRYTSSATYMLNCSLGTLFMPIAAVCLIIFRDNLKDVIAVFGAQEGFLSILAFTALTTMAAMNDISAPSISLEGKHIWIFQSLPVSPVKLFEAKKRLHWLLTIPPVLLLSVAICIVFNTDIASSVLIVIYGVCIAMFGATLGLVLDLKMPNLSWVNEAAPIKQSMPVLICLFGGWLLAVVIAFAGYFGLKYISATNLMVIILVIVVLSTRYMDRWLTNKGAKIFSHL